MAMSPTYRLTLAAFSVLAVGCLPSQSDVQTAQLLNELSTSFNDLRQVQVEHQDRLDSLERVVAKQDSVIRVLANLAGVQLPQP